MATPLLDAPPAEPQQIVVLLGPKEQLELHVEKADLLADIKRELPDEISSPAEYTAVAKLEERLGAFLTKAEPLFDENCDFAHKAWKAACNIRSMFIDGPKQLKAAARKLRGDYDLRQERIRREQERELAEAERKREQDRLNREAKLLEKQGQKDMAAAVRATQVVAPAVSLPSVVPAVTGVTSLRSNWTWRIAGCTDLYGGRKNKDARKRAAKLAPREYLDLDDAAITALVKSQRSSARIPGIEIYEEKV